MKQIVETPEEVKWLTKDEFDRVKWLPADEIVIKKIKRDQGTIIRS